MIDNFIIIGTDTNNPHVRLRTRHLSTLESYIDNKAPRFYDRDVMLLNTIRRNRQLKKEMHIHPDRWKYSMYIQNRSRPEGTLSDFISKIN